MADQQSGPRRDPVLEMVRSKRGTAVRIAAACGIMPPAVWRWPHVPAKHVLAVEALLDIPRHQIRPDLYPPPHDHSTKRWLNSSRRRQHGGSART
jgi:DNA-binding transcriptional regulator YdaS (Cro superfamily)